ncbi:MAG: DUF1800 domain-containing protein [Burkholderiales bacterium]|nr:DUF1800 domain-containing protein [Burkholderiales bacterium]
MLTDAMRLIAAIVVLLLPFAAHAAAIGYDGARHLLNRVGFGATDAEVAEFAKLDRVVAVDRILAGARREAFVAPPQFVDAPFEPYYRLRGMTADERMASQRRLVQESFELRAWWLREMLATPSPLTERMTLFWHNHFATSQQKVRSLQLMYRQNALLRREAVGNFATLLHAVAKDPAMLVYLDNAGSRRQAPNENFAREVMELFTLGEGRYAEADVKEAARAFTGWSLDRESGEFTYRRVWHDFGEKTVLGRTGRFDGDEVLDVLLARPETATLIATKVWREFVSPTPDAAEVERWASVFRESRYEVKPLLRAVLASDAFWSARHRGTLVKSPVDLVVGTLRTFGIHPVDLRPAVFACAALGQNPFAPPNVKGWPGGNAWIDSATLLGRRQFVDRVFRGSESPATPVAMRESGQGAGPGQALRRMLERGMSDYAFDGDRFAASLAEANGARLEALVLAFPAVSPVDKESAVPERVRALVADAAYQLR